MIPRHCVDLTRCHGEETDLAGWRRGDPRTAVGSDGLLELSKHASHLHHPLLTSSALQILRLANPQLANPFYQFTWPHSIVSASVKPELSRRLLHLNLASWLCNIWNAQHGPMSDTSSFLVTVPFVAAN
ncbi:hypothetical protein Cob_v005085 [Colletotrichum orbiculare MAFF 240422]|uniref:Uncharacterized protein n=1 Tax=Colletotrichum orbiculare (strain 104-T / ATCC 96160 / CBS 514.97 / LARS 414 / MAFF 240422) TaxID=1213857 RepID=A0A484FWK5_COLOR|nr:hypothetical protein Cob_v005085 [Colletotrichum orbiculare MAFF 240422]